MEEHTDIDKELFFAEMRKIEQLANRFLQQQFDSSADLWNIQLGLINYQTELQRAILDEKAKRKVIREQIAAIAKMQRGEWKSQIQKAQDELKQTVKNQEVYETALLLSRKLGDAWAWLLLGADEKQIFPLTENLPAASVPIGPSFQGVKAIAQILASDGLGFPVFHDMTDILRIGDLTFVSRGNAPITLEVKTQLADEEQHGTVLEVQVHGFFDKDQNEKFEEVMQKQTSKSGRSDMEQEQPKKKKQDRRLPDQLERMKHATILQTSDSGIALNSIKPTQLIVQTTLNDKLYHWDLLGSLLAQAKTNGYASLSVDNAFVYTALYNEIPLPYSGLKPQEIPFSERMNTDLAASPIWFHDDTTQNTLYFGLLNAHLLGRTSPRIRPFFLCPLPTNFILDVVWQRFLIIVFVNVGKLAEALQKVGFEVNLPANKMQFQHDFITVSGRIMIGDREMKWTLHNLHSVGEEILYELLSLEGFVTVVSEMATTARKSYEGEMQSQ